MKEKYYVGKLVLFVVDNKPASIGEIVNIIPTKDGACYKIREIADEPTNDGYNYYEITNEQIVKINHNALRLEVDEWINEHVNDISEAFDRDVSNYTMAIYDSLEKAKDEFDEYAENDKFCRQVLDKWIFLVC